MPPQRCECGNPLKSRVTRGGKRGHVHRVPGHDLCEACFLALTTKALSAAGKMGPGRRVAR